jgi:hypothetical protein
MIPPKPDTYDPAVPPPGVELDLVSFWEERPKLKPRLQLVHTNAASREGSVSSSKNWAERRTYNGTSTTCPHMQFDRNGDVGMFLPADRAGNASYKANSFCLSYETADTGTIADPTISAFTDAQIEKLAVVCAYYAWGENIPLEYPATWDGTGTACHTEPFAYPLWTNVPGKICPGDKKKAQVRNAILPYARDILAAWTTPPQEDDMFTDDDRAKLAQLYEAVLVRDPYDPADVNEPLVIKVNRLYTAGKVWWDGFPGFIKDGPGSLARTLKAVADKLGVKVG